jgi:glyoxylase-like metal-dependent hydrolase (beta-lactamase superfamily II)
MQRSLWTLPILAALTVAAAPAQRPQPLLDDHTTKISDHVWAIMGFPNIGIVVGNRATLVVDTGLGPRNGQTVARVVTKLSNNQKLFLTTTHFHPEHAAGEAGFPPGTILLRNNVQQQEMLLHGQEMVDQFSKMNAANKDLLTGATLRTPDVQFESELKVDLGGVTARLLWFGGAHTKGDLLTFVEPDGTLISGDVVQNKTTPNISGDGGTPSSWLAVLDKIAMLDVKHVLPDHSAPGDGSLVAAERNFIADVRTRALDLKAKGMPADDAGKQISADLKAKYTDWPNTNVAGLVRSIYAEK